MRKYRTRWIYNIFYPLYAIHTEIYTIHADIYANHADIYAIHADIYTIHPDMADMYVAYSVVMLSTIYIIHASNISYLFLCWPCPASPVSLISPVYK